jgi:diacylglycerol kinase (ATP)
MKKLAIIMNRKSGSSSSQSLLLNHAMGARRAVWGRRCEFHTPDSLESLRALIARIQSPAESTQYDGMIVIGGDGSQHQAIRSFERFPNSVPLYAFPGGTANDLARELGLENNWEQVANLVSRMEKRPPELIDLIECNGVPFATVAGTGIGASLTREFNERRAHSAAFRLAASGMHSQMYTLLSLKTIFAPRDYLNSIHVRAPGFEERLEAAAIFVCNQTFLGGNLRVAPEIQNDDNRFNVMIIPKCSRLKLTMVLGELKLGRLPKEFVIFSTDRLTLIETRGKPIPVFADGETLAESPRLEFRVKPASLRVFSDRAARPSQHVNQEARQ